MDKALVADTKPCVLELEPGTYHFCTCGRSAGQPFCDGSHRGTGFVPQTFELTEKKKVALCACKQSAGQPYCDGSHRNL